LIAVANHSVLIAVSCAFLFPVVYMFFTAVQSDDQVLTGRLWPHPFEWSNFSTVFRDINVPRYLWNTFLYAGLSTVGVVNIPSTFRHMLNQRPRISTQFGHGFSQATSKAATDLRGLDP